MSNERIDTHHLRIPFGRHKGELWTRVPVSYLKWLVNTKAEAAPIAQAELERRGTTLERQVEISGHAIDRASTRLLGKWQATRLHDNEGLHAWLHRLATQALQYGEKEDEWHYKFAGIKFCYDFGEVYPTLTTVMAANR
jgi:hypothetical protein